MGTLLLIAAGIFTLGWAFKVPMRQRLVALAVLWLAALIAALVLSPRSPLRILTGGDPQPLVVVAMVAVAVWGYVALLARLRAKAQPLPDPAPKPLFSEAELHRYARHLMLREVGGPGQKALKQARVLMVGAGGLGSPALLYLAAAGVGTIGVIDDDTVDASNLQRQIIHTDDRLGMPKVFSAQVQMQALNPYVTVRPYHRRLTESDAEALLSDYDLILDGSDNFDTRYLVNRVAVRLGKPLIAAALTQWEGQLSLYDPARGGPCYECLFPERPAPGLVPTCAEAGVIAPLPGVLGSMMALEAVKHLTGAGEGLRGALLIYDGLYGDTRRLSTHRRPGCPVCSG